MRQKLTRTEDGFTLVELLIVVAIIGILASVVTAQLIRAKASANEASTISSLRAISNGQISYMQTCGNNYFATSLTSLGPPGPGESPFISQDLTSGPVVTKSGYIVSLTASAAAAAGLPDCQGAATASGFYASAYPTSFDVSGSRSFAVNTQGAIWQIFAAAAPTEPFGAPAEPIK